jgi:hypothetical protein
MSGQRERTASAMFSIYDGRICVGHILGRGRSGFEAFTAQDESLGLFASQQDAINELNKNLAAGNAAHLKKENGRIRAAHKLGAAP